MIAKRPRRLAGAVFFCALFGFGIAHAADPTELPEAARGIATVLAADRLRVGDSDVLLAGVVVQPDALVSLLAEHAVSARSIDTDRAGRVRAHVLRDDGLWLQQELLRQGLARVAPTADTALFATELLVAEAEARQARRGLWTRDAVRDATDVDRLHNDVGSFQVIEGTIRSAARGEDVIYLNFGTDYREDFTATIPREAQGRFKTLAPLGLAGKRVQVRGWVIRHNGPAVELAVPELLVVLDPMDKEPPKRVRRRSP